MSTRRLVYWITLLAVFAMAARISMDTDTWWHLRAGEWMLAHRKILQTDLFSYTRLGAGWQYPGWLAEAPMALIYRWLGPGGLNLWTAGMAALAFSFAWRTLSGGPFLRAFTLVLAASVSAVFWAARPHLVTFALAAVFLAILEDFRWNPERFELKRLLWLPALMVAWANSHGGFAVGFLLWGVYLAGEAWRLAATRTLNRADLWARAYRLRALLVTGLLMLLGVCLNPAGPAMLLYPFKTVAIGALQDYIQEWQSPNFHNLAAQPFLWLLLLTLGAVGASRRRLALTDFLLVAGFGYLGFIAGRNVALFALAAPPVLTRHLDPLLAALARRWGFRLDFSRKPGRGQAALNRVLLGAILLAAAAKVALVFPRQVNETAFRATLPVAAVSYLEAHPGDGRLLNAYNWGGYLLWSLPADPVFLDGRTDLYNDEIIKEWLTAVRAQPGWQEVLERWQVDRVLLEPGMPLLNELAGYGWRLAYADEVAVIYSRR